MSIYVIDYENTSVAGLNGIEKLLDTDVVVVFFSTNAPKIDIKAVEKIQKSAAKTVFKEANVKITGTDKIFHDALDAQLDTYIGYLMGKYNDKETTYYIVSKDQGFSFVCQYWCNRGYSVKQIRAICEGNNLEEIEKIENSVLGIIGDRTISKTIAKITMTCKTKEGIHNALVKKFGETDGNAYFSKIKPLLKGKK